MKIISLVKKTINKPQKFIYIIYFSIKGNNYQKSKELYLDSIYLNIANKINLMEIDKQMHEIVDFLNNLHYPLSERKKLVHIIVEKTFNLSEKERYSVFKYFAKSINQKKILIYLEKLLIEFTFFNEALILVLNTNTYVKKLDIVRKNIFLLKKLERYTDVEELINQLELSGNIEIALIEKLLLLLDKYEYNEAKNELLNINIKKFKNLEELLKIYNILNLPKDELIIYNYILRKIDIKKYDTIIYHKLSTIYYRLKDYNMAQIYSNLAILNSTKPYNALYIDAFNISWLNGATEEQLIQIYVDAIQKLPYDRVFYMELYSMGVDKNKIVNLLELYGKKNNLKYLLLKSRLLIDQGNSKLALNILLKVHSEFKSNKECIYWLAHLYSFIGDNAKAEKFYTMQFKYGFDVRLLIDYIRHKILNAEYSEVFKIMNIYDSYFSSPISKNSTELIRRKLYFGIKDLDKAWSTWGDRKISNYFYTLSKAYQFDFYKNIDNVPQDNSLLLVSEYGPGDEIRWSTLYNDLRLQQFKEIYISCEPRLYEMMKNSFPKIKFISVNRQIRGRVSTDKLYIYNKLPYSPNKPFIDKSLDNTLWEFILKKNPSVMFIADTLHSLRGEYNTFIETANKSKILIPRNEKYIFWKNYLRKQSNKPLIGISWRSSVVSYQRNMHYFDFNDVTTIINACKDTYDFVNLQYDECTNELDEIYKKTDVKIINPKELNQKEQLEDVAALMVSLDIIISPATTVAELGAAVGTKVFIFNNSKELDWRVLSERKDVWYSNMTHFYNIDDIIPILKEEN